MHGASDFEHFLAGATLGVLVILTSYLSVVSYYLVREYFRCSHYTMSPDWTYESCAKCGSTRSRIFQEAGRTEDGWMKRVQVGWGPWKKRKKGTRRGKASRRG